MDLLDFDNGSFNVGLTLNPEERAALESQMAKRQIEEKLASIKFWGRVSGTTGDYLIVCGLLSVMEAPVKKFYYATSKSLELQQMPELLPEFVSETEGMGWARFTGNPTKLLGAAAEEGEEEEEEEEEEAPEGEDGEKPEGEEEEQFDEDGNIIEKKPKKVKKPKFSEAHRLAATVQAIDGECFLVPRGAFVATPTHQIVSNPLFAGVSLTDACDLAHYHHFRAPRHPARALALTTAAVLGTGDFMDPASEDVPVGCWGVQYEAGRGLVSLRSLKYPGAFTFHVAGTPRFGSVYFGDGRPNADLHFMLPKA